MNAISLEIHGRLKLQQQLDLLAMPKSLRRRLLGQVARKVTRDSKKRVRQQRDLQGKPFASRKRKRARKMLSRLVRNLRTTKNNGLEAIVGFHNPVIGRIAAKHQHGFVEQMDAKKSQKKSKVSRSDPATRRQAIALREADFKIKGANGKRMKSPSLKWITANMNIGQAGTALRYLREQAGETIKTRWTTTLPARSFLGATHAEVNDHISVIFKQMKQEMTI